MENRTIVQQALSSLVGMPLWTTGRAADLQWFHFGRKRTVVDSRRGPKVVGEFALHLQCAWRIRDSTGILVGSRDLYLQAAGSTETENFNWEVRGASVRDQVMSRLIQESDVSPPIVEGATDLNFGTFHLAMSKGLGLDVFADGSGDDEQWRLFKPSIKEAHLVVTGTGASYR